MCFSRRWNRTRPYYPRSRGGRLCAGDGCQEAQSMDTSEPTQGESVAPGLAISAQHAIPSAARAAARDEEPEEGELSLTDGSSDESAEEEHEEREQVQDLPPPPLVTPAHELSLAHEPIEDAAAASRAAREQPAHCVSPAPHFEQLFAASAPLDAQVTAQPSANGALHSHLHSASIRSAPLEDGELSD